MAVQEGKKQFHSFIQVEKVRTALLQQRAASRTHLGAFRCVITALPEFSLPVSEHEPYQQQNT